MVTAISSTVTACEMPLDTSPEVFGHLQPASEYLENTGALHERLDELGYLYLPGFWECEEVLRVRREITGKLAAQGYLDPNYPVIEAVARKDVELDFTPFSIHKLHTPRFLNENRESCRLLFTGKIMELFERLLGGKVLHYDFTWFRARPFGRGTAPHCDIVFFNRGTHRVYSAWVPFGNITPELGGLMILEDSHKKGNRLRNYLRRDSDTYCLNRPDATQNAALDGKIWGGFVTKNPVSLREKLGGRWLTTDYRMGDLLIFPQFTIHCGLDNKSDRIRLSTDTRYQLASETYDTRWVGENAPGHSAAGKRGMIC